MHNPSNSKGSLGRSIRQKLRPNQDSLDLCYSPFSWVLLQVKVPETHPPPRFSWEFEEASVAAVSTESEAGAISTVASDITDTSSFSRCDDVIKVSRVISFQWVIHFSIARWQNLIPSSPWIAPGSRAWGHNGIKFCHLATLKWITHWKLITRLTFITAAREGGGVCFVRGYVGDCARLGFGADRRDGGLRVGNESPREPRRRVSFGDSYL